MNNYVWCEDSKAGFQFWKAMFNMLYPDFIFETKKGNSNLIKAAENIKNDGNTYYMIIDNVVDNPSVLHELRKLRSQTSGKSNVKIIALHSFEFLLLSFEYLENWAFAEKDELRNRREELLKIKRQFVKLVTEGGTADELSKFTKIYDLKNNSERISYKLLFEITKNTGFATDKSRVGSCFINNCCEWNERKEDDICGLDNSRPTAREKMEIIKQHSVLDHALKHSSDIEVFSPLV